LAAATVEALGSDHLEQRPIDVTFGLERRNAHLARV
jgi:hypothetical protein